ncbi:MAG TPA: papain-like cysteine protease family protein [Chloroflexota bacterium]|nr:papain-like cysteine protease family protein [Chloroflexota bacterium]
MPDQNAEIRVVAELEKLGASLQSHRNLLDKVATQLQGASAKAAAGGALPAHIPDLQRQIQAGRELLNLQKGLAQATGDASTAQLAAMSKLQASYVGLGQAAQALAKYQGAAFATEPVNHYHRALSRVADTLRTLAGLGGRTAQSPVGVAASGAAVAGAFQHVGGPNLLGALPGVSMLPQGMRAASAVAGAVPGLGAGGIMGALGLTGIGAIGAQLATWAVNLPAAADRYTSLVPRVEGLYRRGAGRSGRTQGDANQLNELRHQVLDRGLQFGYGRQEALSVAEALAASGGTEGFNGSSARLDAPMQFARYMGVDLGAATQAFAAAERMGAAGITSGQVPSAFGGTLNRVDTKQLADVFAQGIDQSKMRGRESEFLQTVTGLAGTIAQRTVDAPDMQHIVGMLTALNRTDVPGLRGQAGANVMAGVDRGVAGARGANQMLLYQLYRQQKPNMGFAEFLLEQEKGLESPYLPAAIQQLPGLVGGDENLQAIFLKDVLGGNISGNQALALLHGGLPGILRARTSGEGGMEGAALPAVGNYPNTLAPGESAVAALQRFNAAMDEMAGQTMVPAIEKLHQFEANITGSTNNLTEAAGRLFDSIAKGLGGIVSTLGISDIWNPPVAHSGELTPAEKAAQEDARRRGVPMPGSIWTPGLTPAPAPPAPPAAAPPLVPGAVPPSYDGAAPGVPVPPGMGAPAAAPDTAPEAAPGGTPDAMPPPALSDIPNVTQAAGGRDSAARGCSAGALTAILNGAGVDIDEGTVFRMMVSEGVIQNDGLHDPLLAGFVKRHWGLDVSQSIRSTGALRDALANQQPVMLSVNGVQRRDQYPGGHLVTGVSADDRGLTVMDPARGERHTFTWEEFQQVSRMNTNPGIVFQNWTALAQANRARLAGAASMAPPPAEDSPAYRPVTSSGLPEPGDDIIAMAMQRYGPAAGPVVAAILRQEDGLGRTTPGDGGHAYGPFQLDDRYQLRDYARDRGMSVAAAGQYAINNPLDAADWSLSDRSPLGRALAKGAAAGDSGEALLRDALAGQNGNVLLPQNRQYYEMYRRYLSEYEGIGAQQGSLGPYSPMSRDQLAALGAIQRVQVGVDPIELHLTWPDGRQEVVTVQPRARHISEQDYLSRVTPRNLALAGAPMSGLG